jgi:hypothetical protein
MYLSWEVPFDDQAIEFYKVYIDGFRVGMTSVNGFYIDSLISNKEYTIEVYPVDYDGNTANPTEIKVTTLE